MSSWTPPYGLNLRTRRAFLSLFFFSLFFFFFFSRGFYKRVDSILLYSSSSRDLVSSQMPLPGYFSVRTLPRFSSNRSTKGSALRFYAKFLSSLLLLPYSFLREIERAREKRDKTRPERRGGRVVRNSLLPSLLEPEEESECFLSFALKAMCAIY